MRIVLVATCLALAACRGTAGGAVAGQPESLTYASSLGVDLASMTRRPSGLYVKDLVVGTGEEATPGRAPVVHYSGSLPNGKPFDSSLGGEPYGFTLGAGQVIAGWDEGVAGMKVGGRRLLVVPPQLGYGDTGSGPIPPGATLVFEVELVAVR
ncbi:MAG: FKBP-type peptidyl-prolyl cis-trans isomerase [Gemmatimonadales bacterium]|jgi:FKBP-type peptidyl-prolyl cis-trans isomerase|nr:FKBP-type peptidyl-prolyl cis-trans isomerase [Gemmatimonadales bacterium]